MTFEEFKDKYFDGDTDKALEKLAEERVNDSYELTGDKNGFREILDSMDKKAARSYNELARSKNYEKNKDKIGQVILLGIYLNQLNMPEEDVIKSEKNPFVKKTILGLLFLFGGVILFPAIYYLLNGLGIDFEGILAVPGVISASLIGLGSLNVANNILKIGKFKKAKRIISTLEEKTDDNNELKPAPEIDNNNEASINSNTDNDDNDTNNDDTVPLYKDVKEEVGLDDLLTELNEKYKDMRAKGLICGILIPILIPGFVLYSSLIVILMGVACGLPFLISGINALIILKKINKLDFYIKTEKCVRKECKVDEDVNGSDRLYLFFSGGGKYKIDYSSGGNMLGSLRERLKFDSAYVGREYYTIYIGQSRKIRYAIPADENEFSYDDFTDNNGIIYPQKRLSNYL